MKKVQQVGDYSIYQKRSGRYGIQDKAKNWVNGDEKTKTLLAAGLIQVSAPKPRAKDDVEEAPAGDKESDEGSAS